MAEGYFVIGTDTGVGKTLVASALLHAFAGQGLRTVGMKPVAAGCVVTPDGLRCEDVDALRTASNVDVPLNLSNPYALAASIAPHIAAAQAGVTIELDVIQRAYATLAETADVVIVEGVGGFRVPLNAVQDTADLAVLLGLPVILVVGMRLGCLNHALLSTEAVQARGLRLAGWVANQIDPQMEMFEENLAALRERLDAPLLGVVPWQPVPQSSAVAARLELGGLGGC
jgi:dethiobiotin synthetase